MDDLIIIKSGEPDGRAEMPTLQDAEFGYRTDKKELYIGYGGKNVRLCGAGDIEEIMNLIGEITARLDALEAPDE